MAENDLPDWYPDPDRFIPNARDLAADQPAQYIDPDLYQGPSPFEYGLRSGKRVAPAFTEDPETGFQYGLRSGQRLYGDTPRPEGGGMFQYGLRSGQFDGANYTIPDQPSTPPLPASLDQVDQLPDGYDAEYLQNNDQSFGRPVTPDEVQAHIASVRQQIQRKDVERATGLEPFLPHETLSPIDRLLFGAGRGLESGYSGLMGAGEAVSRALAWGGQTPVSRYFQGEGDLARKKAASFENPEKGTDIAGWLGEQIGGFVPLVLGSLAGGLPGFTISGATQAAGSSFKRAQEAFSANGDSDTKAALKALPVGIISGGINALITKYFSPDGTAGQALANGLDRAGLTGIIKGTAEAAGLGAGWGGSEALAQDLLEKLTDNPDKPVGEIAVNVLSSAVAGGGLGLGMAGLHAAGQKLFQRFAPEVQSAGPIDSRTMEQALPESEQELFAGKFEPGDVQISQAGDAFLKMPSGKNGVNILNRMGLITDDEMFDMADPGKRLGIFGRVADRLEADGLSGLVDEKGRTVSTKVLRGQLDQAEAQPNTGASEGDQQAQAGQSEPAPESEMPAPTQPSVQRAGLRRGLRISDQSIQPQEVSNAITPGNEQENIQPERQDGDGQVQGVGPDRNQPATEQTSGAAPKSGNSVQSTTAQQIVQAEAQVDPNPSEAQKEAGNYQKGHVTVHGLDMTIENPVGSTRSGVDKGGKPWSVIMPATYGYVKGTEGKDGDHVDIYLGPQPDLQNVYVVDQQNAETKKFDEHKVLIGFPDQQSAVATYDRAFSDQKGPHRRASVTETTIDQFKNWLVKGDQTKPFAQSSFSKGGESDAKRIEERRQEELLNQTVPGAAIAPAPAQGPSDPRERIKWLMDESKRLTKTDREAGWNMIVEAGDLRAKVIDDEIAKVPENTTSVKLETPLRNGRQNFIIITKSAQPGYAGKWQATRMDERGPSGHSIHDTLKAALKYELDHYDYRVVDIRTPDKTASALPSPSSYPTKATPSPTKAGPSPISGTSAAQPDIIDYIRDNIGRIKGKGTAKSGSEGYYGKNYTSVIQKHSAVRQLFTNKGRGVSPDEAVHDLREAGYLNQNANWDDVIDLLDKAGLQRKGQAGAEQSFNREVEEKARQREDFEKVLQPRLRPTTAVHTSNLLVGDEFKLFGEKVTVKNLLFDPDTDHLAYVELEDGRRFGTQLIGAEHVLHVDHDSYHANPEATEFLPKSDRHQSADEIRAIDEQINELRAKEKLTTEDHRRLELLEQQRGQKMIEFTEPQAVADDAAREAVRQDKLARMPRGNLELSGETIQPEQRSLFELNIPPVGSQFRKAVEQFAAETPFTTFEEFRSKVASSSIPIGIKRSMLVFMDTPGIRDLNWQGFFMALGQGLPHGMGGFVTGNKLAIDTSNALTTTLPHEVTHLLWNSIPEEMRQAIERTRLVEVRTKYGVQAPEELVSGRMSSDEFVSSGLPASDYHLTSPEEYFASFAGNRFAREFLDKEYPSSGIWQKIVDWFKALWTSIKQHFIHTPEGEQAMKDVYDRMMKGEFQPSPEKFGQPKASFLQSAEGARNVEKLTEGTAYEKTEAAHAMAQGVDFVRILDAKGAATASPLAKSLLRYGDYAQYKTSGANLNGGKVEDFRALMARTDLSDYEKKWMARIAARQAATFHQTLEEAQRIGTESDRQMRSPGFLKQLAREATLHSQLNQAEAINRASDLILNSAYEQAWKALREEQHNDLEVAQLEAQLREIDEARKSSSAMVQLLKDLVNVLSSSATGQQLLNDPNVRRSDLVKEYRDLKQSTGQPIQAESLVNWGSFILARASDLRSDLLAAYYQQANPYVQHGLSHYEKMLFDDLKKDPAGTIYREVRLAKKRQSNEDKLRFTWWQLNRDVMAKLAKLTGEVEAGMIARSTMADHDYRDTTNLMKKEGGWVGQGNVLQPYVDTTLMTPGGRAVDISTSSMRGSGVRDKLWKEWEDARRDFTDHINNNPDDPDNPLYQRQLNALEEYYHDETIRNPHDRDLIWAGAADAVQEAAFRAGGSTAASLARAIQKWTMVKERGAAQVSYDAPKFFLARDRTLFSHGLRHDRSGGKEAIEVVSRRFYGDHMNEVMYSLNRQAGPIKVGDETRNGYKVTQEDLDEAALQSDIYERAWKVVKDAFGGEDFHVTITDPRTGLTMTMTPVKGTRYFVARRFEPNQKPFADAFVKSLGAEADARKVVNSLDPSVTAAQKADATRRIAVEQQKQIELLEAPGTWDRQLYGFVSDRNPDFAHVTPFDGPGKAFALAAPLAARSQIKTFDQFIDFLTAHSAVPKAEAQAIVLTEWKRLISGIGKDEESPLVIDPKSATKKNSFTKGRMEAQAPFTFYRYGLMDGSDLSLLLSYVHSRALERVENGLVALQKDLEERISELRNKADLSSRNKVISAREAEVRAGKNFDSYEDLNKRKGVVDRVLRYLADPDPEDKGDITWRRITGGATGAIVQNSMTTLQNMIGSWMFLGRLSVRLNSKPIFDYPAAFWYTFSQIPFAAYHVGRAGTRAVIHGVAGMGRAVREAQAAHNKGRRIRAFASVPLENAIFELSEQLFKAYAPDLVKQGVNPIQNKQNDLRARMLLGWARGGRIGSEELTGGRKVGHSVLGAVEIPMMLTGAILPTIGDLSQNKASMAMLADNPFGFRKSTQRALNKVFKAGLRTFNWNDLKDPANTLSHKELGYLTKQGMEEASVWMRESGLSLQTEAMKYLKALHDRTPNPEFLSGDSFTMFIDHQVAALNKATAANKAITLESAKPIIRLTRPLLGWSIRTWNFLLRAFSGASHDERRWIWWALGSTLGVLPFLLGEIGAGVLSDEMARLMSRYWYGKESNKKLPLEYDTTQQRVLALGKNAAYNVPFLGLIMNTLLGDVPTRASATPSFVMLEKFKDLTSFVGGLAQTGNPAFGLSKIATSLIPESRAIFNRIPSEIGRIQGQDASALIRRYAPTDLVKPLQPAAVAGVLTELSPYGNMLENQALRGDDQAFKQTYDQAVATAKKLGLAKPEERVRQSFLARNPIDRVFKVKPTQRQLNDLMARMSGDEQAKVGQVMSNFKHAAGLIGADVEFTKEPSLPPIKMGGGLRNNLGPLPSFGRRGR